jgi:hypothetical protein
VKRFVASNFDTTWEKFRKQGEALLSAWSSIWISQAKKLPPKGE